MKGSQKTEIAYKGISLRREHVENDRIPEIIIFYKNGFEAAARQAGFGIEEEGIPNRMVQSDSPMADALDNTLQKGLGVAIGIDDTGARIFCRQYKKNEPLFRYRNISDEMLRGIGQNSARMLKKKPLVQFVEQ